jgi:arylsulfatase A-like enzyme
VRQEKESCTIPEPLARSATQESAAEGTRLAYLGWAVALGLLTGLAEAALAGVFWFGLQRRTYLGIHVIWMAPLANLCLFGVVGLVAVLLGRWRPRLCSPRRSLGLFLFLAVLSLLLWLPWIHPLAALLLAAGLAAQAVRWMETKQAGPEADRSSRSARLLLPAIALFPSRRHVLLGCGATVAGLASGAFGWQELVRRRALSRVPSIPTDRPNVLLLVLDTVRARSLSLHGCQRETTPFLWRFAERGVRFDCALAAAPWTTPSHASFFTGRWPHELSDNWYGKLDDTYPTLAEVLSGHGYRTAGFVANVAYCGYQTGLDRGFTYYEDHSVSPGEVFLSSRLCRAVGESALVRRAIRYYDIPGRKKAADINRRFLDWMGHDDRRPFFAFLNYYDVHEPYLPPPPFDRLWQSEVPRRNHLLRYWQRQGWRSAKEEMSPAEVQAELDAYEACLAYLDSQVGRLLAELDGRGVLENTLVIITSDHGEQFGEHGLFGHGNSLYLPLLHVPLLMAFPARVPAGASVNMPVSLRDLPATIMDLIGCPSPFPGRSLAGCWTGTDPPTAPPLAEVGDRTSSPGGKGILRAMVHGRYHYIRHGDGQEELYDIIADPMEKRDLAATNEGSRQVERLRAELQRAVKRG